MTTPDVRTEPGQSTIAMTEPSAEQAVSRRYRFGLIGMSALLVATAGLAGTLTLCHAQSTDSTTSVTLAAPSVSVVPQRDQWYLEPASSSQYAAAALSTMNGKAAGAAVRDQWYLDPVVSSLPPVYLQSRDRWYLDTP